METRRERVISIVLTEQDWQAFVQTHPQPVQWLRERITESIAAPTAASLASGPAAASTTSETKH